MVPLVTSRRFSVSEHHRMVEVGIIGPDERTELIDGAVVLRTKSCASHIAIANRLTGALVRLNGDQATVSPKNPLRLDGETELFPDIALLSRDVPSHRLPEAADARLVVEVAVTTEALDRNVKLFHYAKGGIPEAWLVLPEARTLETFRIPGPGGYAETALYTEADTVDVLGKTLNVADIFPPRTDA